MSKRATRLAVERLDERRLPSSGVTASLAKGVLLVKGTSGDDRVVLNTSVQGRPARPYVVVEGVGKFLANRIRTISIDTGAGNDFVAVNVRRPSIGTRINAGPGNDTVYATPFRDVIVTGPGNSTIFGRGGRDRITTGVGQSVVNGKVIVVRPSTTTPQPTPTPRPTPSPTTPSPPTTYTVLPTPLPTVDLTGWVNQIATLTNAERAKVGLGALRINDKLSRIAEIAVSQMLQTGVVSHDMKGTAYPGMRERASAANYQFNWLGENLAFNLPDPARLVQAWMLSPGHRENMLFGDFTEMGIAVGANAYGQVYAALEFGQPS